MLVIKVCIWPYGRSSSEREIGRAYIWNIGTGTDLHGDYHIALMKDPEGERENPAHIQSRATIVGFPRGPKNLWPLVREALKRVRPTLRMVQPLPLSHGHTEQNPLK